MKRNLKHYEAVAVAGFGLTGVSVARFLLRHNVTPLLFDTRAEPPGLALAPELANQCECYFEELKLEHLLGLDLIIVSPGIDTRRGPLRMAAEAGVVLISDIELFAWYATAPVLAITGSNGKSTVTELVTHLLTKAGQQVAMGGNIGTPALDLLTTKHDLVVLELSSFQLELTFSLALQAACILNISPDHLDRYDDERAYWKAKQGIYAHAQHLVWNADDDATKPIASEIKVASTPFGQSSWTEGFGLQHDNHGHWLCWRGTRLINTAKLPLVGVHNWLNVMAALALCRQAGLEPAIALQHIHDFKALPHRCELVAQYFNVRWIDDSKATNAGATAAAVAGLRPDVAGKLILIAGGDAKGAHLNELIKPLADVDVLITLGRDGPRIAALKEGAIEVKTMQEAVAAAKQQVVPHSVVLLSPACASLDMFSNYKERGKVFRQAVEVAHGGF
ncbi:UDP-N-acetylmuramoyl-L-alanine--D-glutamate ligase [Aliidiomarina quisquiliarum]|uniref:UDP-N-acetylmuramoyl-L-alanine--D-glutamate ligase n=1 Tax=Aliidiomarina quisquiliarum TaxID=2938947 RepID=UPI00208E1975|nr:UDP-N-acetylmuramoyl-L-alanine--D-glutamate ligase [Aliidiomarina quisquiliarum]MCO4321461.1 UDP-N-acetylmuramoyl-L-alanine--D-glutamate ligase [Aliidiomarina quisquiliarum]